MKERVVYTCEFCKVEYAKKQDAIACEAHHLSPKKIINTRYLNMRKDKCQAPLELTVEMENGEKYIYQRTHR